MLLKIDEEDATATATSSFPVVVSAVVVITGVKIDLTEVVTADVDVVVVALVRETCAFVTAFTASLETFENSNAGGCETEGLKVNTEFGAEVTLAKLNALVLTAGSAGNLAVALTGVTVTAAGVGIADIEIGDLKLKIAPPVVVFVTVVVLGELNLKSVAELVVAVGVLGDVTLLIDKAVPVIGAEKLKVGDGLTVFVPKDGASDFAVNENDSCVVGTNAELTVVVRGLLSTAVVDDGTLEKKGLVEEDIEGNDDVDEKLNWGITEVVEGVNWKSEVAFVSDLLCAVAVGLVNVNVDEGTFDVTTAEVFEEN
uniref:Uncharacterized protein n=1 Tax=Photinus pyralis TaxID=7054 RepID=A0A1Y1KWM5_PHOPY